MSTKILWGVCLAVLMVVIVTLSLMLESYETEVWVGESEQARRNPFLASQQFLEAQGVTVFSDNDQLDFTQISTDNTVLLSNLDGMLVSQSQINSALEWVEAGGFLIAGVVDETSAQWSLLDAFDISPRKILADVDDLYIDDDGEPMSTSERLREINRQIEQREQEGAESNDELSESNTAEQSNLFDLMNIDFEHEYYSIQLEDTADSIYLAVLDRIVLDHPYLYEEDEDLTDDYEVSAWSTDENGVRLIQLYYGGGTFTALSSSDLWTNNYIGLADHAYFLSYLVPDDSTLNVFYDVNAPSLLALLHRYFYELIWASLALLALWLWSRSIRVQNVVEVVEGQRRDFTEHLAASAEFIVKNDQFDATLKPLKTEIEQLMRPHCHHFSDLNAPAKISLLAEHTSISEAVIQQWVNDTNNIANKEHLFAALKIGQAIRNSL